MRSRLPVDPTHAVDRRRGGVLGTGAASGSPEIETTPGSQGPKLSDNTIAGPLLLEAMDVARLLGIGRTKVYEMVARRELPTVRVGRCVRVPAAGLARWIDANTRPSAGA